MRMILGPLLAITAGCYGDGEGLELYLTDVPARCASFACPLALGATATAEVGLQIGDTVESDDRYEVFLEPAGVLAARRVPYGLELTGLAEGAAVLRLVHEYHQLAVEVPIRVAAVASSVIVPSVGRLEFPVGDRLAVLHDSTVVLVAEHFAANGDFLAGRGIDAWALSGATGAALEGEPGARTQQLITRDLEGFTVDTGVASIAIAVVDPAVVQRIELVNLDGLSPVAAPGATVRVRQRYNAAFHVAAYDAGDSYVAGGGRAEDFEAVGPGIRSASRAARGITLEITDTDLDVRLGSVTGRFAIRFP